MESQNDLVEEMSFVEEISLSTSVTSPTGGGRPQLVSDTIISKISLANRNADLAGASVSSANIIKMIEIERRLELGPEVNSESLKPLSKSSGARYVSVIAPVVIRNADMQNRRRWKLKMIYIIKYLLQQ